MRWERATPECPCGGRGKEPARWPPAHGTAAFRPRRCLAPQHGPPDGSGPAAQPRPSPAGEAARAPQRAPSRWRRRRRRCPRRGGRRARGAVRGGGRRGGGGRSPRDPPAPPGPGTRRCRQLRPGVALGAAAAGAQRRRGHGEGSAGSVPPLPSRSRRGARPGAATGRRPPGQVRPLAVSGRRDAAERDAEPRARRGRPLTCRCRRRRPGDAGRRRPRPGGRRAAAAGGGGRGPGGVRPRRAPRTPGLGSSRGRTPPCAAPEGAGGGAGGTGGSAASPARETRPRFAADPGRRPRPGAERGLRGPGGPERSPRGCRPLPRAGAVGAEPQQPPGQRRGQRSAGLEPIAGWPWWW